MTTEAMNDFAAALRTAAMEREALSDDQLDAVAGGGFLGDLALRAFEGTDLNIQSAEPMRVIPQVIS